MPQIKYIGKKEFFPDFIAQSGKSWNGYGDVQEVTDDQAKRLLVHDDEFAEKGAHDALLVEQAANAVQIPVAVVDLPVASSDVQEVTDDQAKRLLVHDDEFAEKGAHDALLVEQAANAVQIPVAVVDLPVASSDVQEVTAEEIGVMNKVELFALAGAKGFALNEAAPVAALRKQLANLLFPAA